jgi:hypothetical protein
MRRTYVVLMTALLVAAAAGARPVAGWFGAGGLASVTAVAQASATPTPTPSLGSTPQTGVEPPGVGDGDPQDYDRTPLVVISFLFLGLLVAGSLGFYLWRRTRRARASRRARHQGPG